MRLLLLFLLNCTSSEKKIKIGISPDYPPFEFSEKGALKGFDVDLAYLLEKKLNHNIQPIYMKTAKINYLTSYQLASRLDTIVGSALGSSLQDLNLGQLLQLIDANVRIFLSQLSQNVHILSPMLLEIRLVRYRAAHIA